MQSLSIEVSADTKLNEEIAFNIPQQRADLAIVEFANQADMTYIFPFDEVKGKNANSVVGVYTREEAIKILLKGTGLQPEFADDVLNIRSDHKTINSGDVMKKRGIIGSLIAAITMQSSVVLAQLGTANTQTVLEEIVVTAQRREQSIMEIPISLEAYSGAVLNQEGLRSLVDLANFSPSIEMQIGINDQVSTVRGLGTYATNPGIEQGVPIFIDGIHFGRLPMIMGAFLDLERIEVLRGPQPVAFGMNATAGAFSLTTRNPGPEWEGEVTAEYGNFGRASVEGGIGGPITDTLGIRVAGQWDKLTGYVRDIITDNMFPHSKEIAARVTLQWSPSDNFEATFKTGYTHGDRAGDGNVMCRTKLPVVLNERAITVPGLTSFDDVITVGQIPADCPNGFSRVGLRESTGNSFKPVPDIRQEDTRTGILDITSVIHKVMPFPGDSGYEGTHDIATAFNNHVGLNYEFDNSFSITSNTAYVDYKRQASRDNSSAPILTNVSRDPILQDMWSQEIRLLSPRDGIIEWEAGAYYHIEDLDANDPRSTSRYVAQTVRPQIRQPIRYTYYWQDARWMSAFASVTYNFLNDKASVDIGGRYTDVQKESHKEVLTRAWIFDINPIDPLTGRANSTNLDGTVRNVASTIINCATGHPHCGTYGAGFWSHQWRANDVPDAWHTRAPVDAGPIVTGNQDSNAIFNLETNADSFDPQVTLRYRPNDDISLYGKWARAFKAGGADISHGSLPSSLDEFELLPEYAETFEVGTKGRLLDGRALFNVTLFTISIEDLQIETNVPVQLGSGRRATNAGKQRTRGVEFDLIWAVSDRLTAGLNGAFMDGVMSRYPGAGCNDIEFEEAATGPCLTAEESVEMFGTNEFEGTIDRTGYKAPRTPDYKFVLNLDYWYPVFDQYKVTLASRTTFSDSFVINVQDFEDKIKYGKRTIANLTFGFGDQNDTWKLNFWVRNLLGRSQGLKYYPEFDPPRAFSPFTGTGETGVIYIDASTRDYTTYGVQFNYKYN